MSVEPTTAAWLKSSSRSVTASDNGIGQVWGDLAIESEGVSPFSGRDDASAENVRQLAFLGHPIAVERCLIHGLRSDLIGRLVDLTTDRGNLSGTRCLVIGIDEQRDADTTILTILRRLD